MADVYYSANLGDSMPASITVGSVSTGATFEFRLTYTASGVSKADAHKALEAIQGKILQGNWPPA